MYVGIKLFPVLRVPEPVRDKGQCAAHEALYARSTPRHGNTKPLADLLQRQICGVIGLCLVSHPLQPYACNFFARTYACLSQFCQY